MRRFILSMIAFYAAIAALVLVVGMAHGQEAPPPSARIWELTIAIRDDQARRFCEFQYYRRLDHALCERERALAFEVARQHGAFIYAQCAPQADGALERNTIYRVVSPECGELR